MIMFTDSRDLSGRNSYTLLVISNGHLAMNMKRKRIYPKEKAQMQPKIDRGILNSSADMWVSIQ